MVCNALFTPKWRKKLFCLPHHHYVRDMKIDTNIYLHNQYQICIKAHRYKYVSTFRFMIHICIYMPQKHKQYRMLIHICIYVSHICIFSRAYVSSNRSSLSGVLAMYNTYRHKLNPGTLPDITMLSPSTKSQYNRGFAWDS